jgi:hypothetical protein
LQYIVDLLRSPVGPVPAPRRGAGARAGAADAAAPAKDAGLPPLVGDVLTCGKKGEVGSLQNGTDLLRVEVDTAKFPNALCNDGSTATFFARVSGNPAARNRWLIELSGGGTCRTPADCAARWCSADTNFGMQQMTSKLLPAAGTTGAGITERIAANPLGDWNHVYVPYCSSDDWSGTARDVVLVTKDPVTQGDVTFRMHFLGGSILDAVVAMLRRDGAPAVVAGGQALPDLDDAEVVVLAGASAGGAGVKANLDRLAAALRAKNNQCQGEGCPLQVVGLMDSSYSPDLGRLDFSTTTMCSGSGLCDYPSFVKTTVVTGSAVLWNAREDESCHTWHQANDPSREWMCGDATHVLRNHVTTPFFLRMSEQDQLHASNLIEAKFSVPNKGLMTLPLFGELIRTQLGELATLGRTAEEGAAFVKGPGVYAPVCSKHDTLRSNPDIYDVRVRAGAADYAMFDAFTLWRQGATPSVLVAQPGDPVVCPK